LSLAQLFAARIAFGVYQRYRQQPPIPQEDFMEHANVGWIAAIIIGGIAGWLAEKLMESNMGVLMNIILGIVGAIVASWLFGILGIGNLTGNAWLNYLITGFIGACILIFVGRLIRR
jgi:uncharacterized membrane protein YeaQ/YmgE (transglycosylase-associated protein family)